MRHFSLLILGMSFFVESVLTQTTQPDATSFTLRVLHNNDGESSLLNVDHFAAVLAGERAAAEVEGIPSIMLSSGDNFLAGFVFNYSQQTGIYYDAMALDRLNYDALCLGNHDFDYGTEVLADFINSYELSTPPYLSANLDFSTDANLAPLETAGRLAASTIITKGGEQIGIIGLTTPELSGISSPGDVGVGQDVVSAVMTEVTVLENAGVNKIILVSHMQSVTTDVELAAQLTGIDLIIAGGGDQLLTNNENYAGAYDVYGEYPLTYSDADGAPVYIVTTIGNYNFLGSLKLTFDANGVITSTHIDESDVIEVPSGENDPFDLDMYNDVVAPLEAALGEENVIATTEIAWDVRKPVIRSHENGIGSIVADSYLAKAQEWAATDAEVDMPVFGMANGGGIRSNTIYSAGPITDQDIQNILPFPNYIAIMEDVPAEVVKRVLENAYSQLTTNVNGEVVSDDGRFAHISGGVVTYDLSGEAYTHDASGATINPGSRIVSLVLADGTVVVENGMSVDGVTVDMASVDFSMNGGDFYPFDQAGQPVLVSEYLALDAFEQFLVEDLGGFVMAADYAELPGLDEGRQIVIRPTCDDLNACTFGEPTTCFYADECGVCGGDGSSCIEGCTEPTACNYYDLAVIDDGSCIIPTPGNPCPTQVEVYVTMGTDDVEEQMDPANPYFSGYPYMDSSDLELINDGGEQEVGIRFAELNVPAGATITEAYIQFTADNSDSGETNLQIHVEDAANPGTYAADVLNDISGRTKYGVSVEWANVPAWTAGLAGLDQRTPDLASLVQHIVDSEGWAAGNAINFIITGTGEREAESFENDEADASLAPKLVVSYQDLSGEGCTDAAASNYDAAATEDDGSCTYAISFQIAQGTDDVEETLNDDATYYDGGLPYMDSSDLELVEDGDATQAVGVRFTGLNIAQGQTIASAHIQFTTDEISAGPASLTIAVQDAANNNTFNANTAFDVSGRPTLLNTVAWSPADWNTVGEAGEAQRTPDLASLVQAIVDKADWAPYNAMTFMITGSGSRIAEAYEGDPSAAARLVIEVVGEPVVSQGCTDESAANYDPAAGVDDGSCIYTQVLTIADIQQAQLTESLSGAIVQTSGVVSYSEGSFFALQDGNGPYSGISVYSSGNGLNVGDDITITGVVTEYNGLTELIQISDIVVNTSDVALPAHEVIATNDLNDEQWESVLVATTGTVTGLANVYGEWLINDGSGDAQVDDYIVEVPADLALGQIYTVQGLSSYAYGSFELRATSLEQQVVLAPCVLGTVYVSEAHSEGADAGYGNDYIEIYNSGANDCSLEGFKLDDNDSFTDLTFGEVVVPAGGFWWGVKDEPGSFESGLGANGDFVYLMDLDGNVLFVELAPAAETAAQIFDATGTGCFAFPTPGAPNGPCVTVGCTDVAACNFDAEAAIDDNSCTYSDGVYACDGVTCINDADGDGICDELETLEVCQLGVVYVSEAHTSGEPADYIEIYNSGDSDCLLTGFQLDDNVELADLTFGTVVIEAGGFWVGYEDAPGSFNSGLSSGGDLVVFADPQSNMLIVEAGPSIGNLSKSYDADGNGCYTNPTPGAANEACGVVGCTDDTACNYNVDATNDDGSCTFSDGIIDCNGICINDADGDGICDENEGLAGCTDPLAENYNAQATEDDGSCWASDINYTLAGSYATGQFDAGAAEIVDYHPGTRRIFAVNAAERNVSVLDASDPANLTLAFVIDATAYGASANSVAVFGDHVAVAIEAEAVDGLGQVVIFDVDGNFVSTAPTGYWPDALSVSFDGTMIAVANEGQPSDDYTIDPVGSATIIDVTDPANPVATQIEFDGITEADLPAGTRIFGPNATIAMDLEPEYVAFSGDDNTLFINCQENNCMIVADVATGAITNIWSYGFKDHSLAENALDASNQDGTINITTWPVKGMYMPDAIHSFETGGMTYIVTANEGDARDYDTYSEEARIRDLALDPMVFPDAATLQANENLGRLLTSTEMGDWNGDGLYEELYSYGARSFTIWSADGTLVYDSGREFADIVSTLFPEDFNSNNSGNDSFDSRSDDKGVEPEGVDIGEINGRMYAFIGLERQSAVLIYDITNPAAPIYQRYLSNRDFSVSNNEIAMAAEAAGDLGPEGLKFISAADSPDGMPYLITGNEISGTVTAYALTSDVIEQTDVFGCMYPNAFNYDSEATVDDLSCEFDLPSSCPADLTQDGVVNTQDLLEFLVSFGSFCE
ncbi:MAG: choice-of-anchor I family protein [Bacteroidetes bacterium]|nr:choice-of-anchor I family protein [Bacteroidota bacterium]MDA0904529.1 choice-of-anchor I family protein [Bacteroidota bacterium]